MTPPKSNHKLDHLQGCQVFFISGLKFGSIFKVKIWAIFDLATLTRDSFLRSPDTTQEISGGVILLCAIISVW